MHTFLSCALLIALTLTESTLIDEYWELRIRQDSPSVVLESSVAIVTSNIDLATSIARVMSSSIDETPTSFIATSAAPVSESTPAETTTSVTDTPTTTSAEVPPTSTSVPDSTTAVAAGPAPTTQGSPSFAPETSNTPEATPNGNNGSSEPGAPTSRAAAGITAAASFANGLGTTTRDGTLIVATTNARGQTTTLMGAEASSATRVVQTYTSALLTTSQSLATYRTTRVVDGSTSIGDATSSVPITLTTGMVTATNAAELANGGSNNNSNGLSAADKKTIGGVVGGVGGALLIGGILLVLWRLRKKKNDKYTEDEDYPENEYTKEQKRISRGSQQAFSDGSERYHNPANPTLPNVHPSSNF